MKKKKTELTFTNTQILEWKKKAEEWDALNDKISKFYINKEGEYDEENPEASGDLIDIGEIAATAFGYF